MHATVAQQLNRQRSHVVVVGGENQKDEVIRRKGHVGTTALEHLLVNDPFVESRLEGAAPEEPVPADHFLRQTHVSVQIN